MISLAGWIKLANQGYIHLRQYMEFSKIPEILMRYKLSGRDQDKIVDSIHWRYIEAANGDVQLLLDQLKYMEFETKLEAPYFLQLQYLLSTYVQPIYVYYLENPGFMFNTTGISYAQENLATRSQFVPKDYSLGRSFSECVAFLKSNDHIALKLVSFYSAEFPE